MSTNQNVRYFRSNFIPVVQVTNSFVTGDIDANSNGNDIDNDADDPNTTNYLDIFNPSYAINICKAIKSYVPYPFDGTLTIENISYRMYGTTSLWWIIIMYNGLTHPLEIQPGTVLFIPSISDINQILTILPKNQIGQIVQI